MWGDGAGAAGTISVLGTQPSRALLGKGQEEGRGGASTGQGWGGQNFGTGRAKWVGFQIDQEASLCGSPPGLGLRIP